MITNPLVTIIIPTLNSGTTIERCLYSLKTQSYANMDILIIDAESKDHTLTIAEKFGASVHVMKSERAKAKNFGLSIAKGEYVLFIDSDMELSSRVVEECILSFENSQNAGGIIIPERTVGSSFWAQVRAFERSFYAETEIESARFFKTSHCRQVGGFDEKVIFYEESTLPNRIRMLGYNVSLRVDSVIYHIEENMKLATWLRKKYYYSRTVKQYSDDYLDSQKKLSSSYRLQVFLGRKNRSRFLSSPRLAIGVIFLKGLEFLTYRIANL